jgi:hypothetical protein
MRRSANESPAPSPRGSGSNRLSTGRLLCLVMLAASLAFASAASAKTTNQYLSQIDRSASPTASTAPNAVAVSSAGDIYAAVGVGGIEHYDSSGAYLGQIEGSATPRGAMSSNYVAVASNGDVYVSDAEGGVVDRFSASGTYLSQLDGGNTPQASFLPNLLAAGPGGDIYVADESNGVIDEFDSSGAFITQFEGAATPQGSFCVRGLAGTADGHVYVGDVCNGVVDEFEASGAYVGQFDGSSTPQGFFSPGSATVGANGHLYIGDLANGVVDEFEASGGYVSQFDGATTPRGSFSPGGESLPVAAAPGGSLYVADGGVPVIDKFSETRVVVPDVTTEPASALDQTVATLNGTVNPDGVAATYQFEWGTDTSYGNLTPGSAAPAGSDSSDHQVSAALTGLQPNTTYHYRLTATNANGTTHGLDETFITPALPSIAVESSESTSTEATLKARINPNGTETFYRFDYGADSSYGTSLPIPDADADADIGEGRSDQAVTVHIVGLQPETTYHYRVVAHSTVGATESGDLTFRTAGGLFPLPDNRAWEQVTPLDNGGVNVSGITNVSDDGNAVAYLIPAGLGGAESNRILNPYVARRTATGWITNPLILPQALSPRGEGFGQVPVSSDLTEALLRSTPLTAGSPPSSGGTTVGGSEYYIETLAADPHAPPTFRLATPLFPTDGATYLGGTPNFSTLIFSSPAPLTADPIIGGAEGVYEFTDTGLGANSPVRRLDVDNAGTPLPGGVRIATEGFNAVSANGSRVFIPDTDGRVYARTNGQTTTTVSDPSPSECDPACLHPAAQSAAFAGASEDGTKAYFITTQELVAADTDTTADLYEYDFSRPAGHHVVLISAGDSTDPTPGSGADVIGVARLSDDGSRAAFVAGGVLTTTPNSSGQHPVAGANNLYVANIAIDGSQTTKFVGVMPEADSGLWNSADYERQIQASSTDGRYLIFSTHARLTPDDTDGAADIYRFDDQSGELVRVSHGQDGYGNDGNGDDGAFIEAPRFDLGGPATGPRNQNGRRRAVSDDGSTVVFWTAGSLQEVDQNGKLNVYEWHDGAVALIGDPQDPSTGSDPVGQAGSREATLSRSGADLFIASGASLLPQDVDGVKDIYDARVDGGFSENSPPGPCNPLTDSCQTSPTSPPSPAPFSSADGNSKGNTEPNISLQRVGASALAKFAKEGVLTFRATAPAGGVVTAEATARIEGKTTSIGSDRAHPAATGTVVIRIRISKAARRELAADGKLDIQVTVTDSKLGMSRSMHIKLTSQRPSHQNKGGRS